MKKYWQKFNDFFMSTLFARVGSLLLVGLFVAQILLNQFGDPKNLKLSVIILVFVVLQVLLSGLVSNRFNDIYKIFKRAKRPLDERQMAVRRRVYELSYRIMTLFVVFVVFPVIISEPGWVEPSLAFISLAYLIYVLPSILAAWRRDA